MQEFKLTPLFCRNRIGLKLYDTSKISCLNKTKNKLGLQVETKIKLFSLETDEVRGGGQIDPLQVG